MAVIATADLSGAHINPAVTLGLAVAGLFEWVKVAPFILAQILGAMLGAFTVFVFFKNHFRITETPGLKKACFCTAPAIADKRNNFFSEFIGTFVLILAVLLITLPCLEYEIHGSTKVGLGSLGALPVARDFGPRIVHALVPLLNKDNNDWKYAWVPIFGPIAGAVFAAFVYLFIENIVVV